MIYILLVLAGGHFQPLATYSTLAACEAAREQIIAVPLDTVLGRYPRAICLPTEQIK